MKATAGIVDIISGLKIGVKLAEHYIVFNAVALLWNSHLHVSCLFIGWLAG